MSFAYFLSKVCPFLMIEPNAGLELTSLGSRPELRSRVDA